ncbi:MAG TPA: tripartite tricarboxylate transporter substrate binding protein [Xanthobacteraceae bacterium]|nr:tripartite tricarboxylate transporter substrate binding protein [Xanthobacteraceae bacterium]
MCHLSIVRHLSIAMMIALLSVAGATGPARAQEVIKIVVPFAAGGPVDAVARLLANEMQSKLGATIVVENRPGAGGVIATEAVARAAADGKTLLMASQGSQVISGVPQANPKYDPSQSFDPIAMVGRVPMLLIINPNLPVNDFKELIALARTRTLTYGSAGAGTVMHIAGELINTGANVTLTHVPYRGVAPALPDLIGGRLDVIPADPPVLLPLVRTNTVRAIAVLGRERLASLPDIPTLVELGYPDMVMENWYGLLAPAGLAPAVATRLETAALAAIKSPKVQEHMQAGELSGTLDSRAFRARMDSDIAFWRPMLPKLGITAP